MPHTTRHYLQEKGFTLPTPDHNFSDQAPNAPQPEAHPPRDDVDLSDVDPSEASPSHHDDMALEDLDSSSEDNQEPKQAPTPCPQHVPAIVQAIRKCTSRGFQTTNHGLLCVCDGSAR